MSQTAGPPSLDPGYNNSTASESVDNDRYDCREVYGNFRFQEVDEDNQVPFRCGSWECYCCGYHMRMNLVEEIGRVCRERPEMSRLMTLTLNPDKAPAGQGKQHRYITDRWNALRTALTREFGDVSYIWVREEQDSGLPHLHFLVSRYIPQGWLSSTWDHLGGGEVVDIREVDRVDKAANYIGKYLTKDALSGLPDGTRRYGSSQDITLAVRGGQSDSSGDWEVVMEDYTGDQQRPTVRPVEPVDFLVQRVNGGPIGQDIPPPAG